MNIKFSSQSVTFKISEEELKSLIVDKKLIESLLISGQKVSFAIFPVQSGEMVLDLTEGFAFSLQLPNPKIQELSEMGKSRDGIFLLQDNLKIFVQVDVKSDTRSRKKD
ncbi:MAG TPA: hypothetical protein PLE43_07905 [Alphaproteobacteria bacterium]|jgi:hypothetical protein|nr:hypothetical protein [Alphaproteobacteria bacterium]